jgi:hypothetical protein
VVVALRIPELLDSSMVRGAGGSTGSGAGLAPRVDFPSRPIAGDAQVQHISSSQTLTRTNRRLLPLTPLSRARGSEHHASASPGARAPPNSLAWGADGDTHSPPGTWCGRASHTAPARPPLRSAARSRRTDCSPRATVPRRTPGGANPNHPFRGVPALTDG